MKYKLHKVEFDILHCLAFRAHVGFENRGGVAQLGEHLPCKQGVRSSILLISTTLEHRLRSVFQKDLHLEKYIM